VALEMPQELAQGGQAGVAVAAVALVLLLQTPRLPACLEVAVLVEFQILLAPLWGQQTLRLLPH
jgi:hypothetical protein